MQSAFKIYRVVSVFFIVLQNIFFTNVHAQLSDRFINLLPDSIKNNVASKKILSVSEKINILKTITIVAYKQFANEYDSVATSLEKDQASSDIITKINIEDRLNTYYKQTSRLEKSLQHCNVYLQLTKGKKEYAVRQGETVMLKGSMLSSLGRYEESILFLYGALEDYKAMKDSIGAANVFSGLSYPYLSLQLADTALNLLDSSLIYFGKIDFRNQTKKIASIFFSTMLQNYYLACLLLYEKTASVNYINKMKGITDILAYQKISSPIPKTFPALSAYSKGQFDSAIQISATLLAEPVKENYFSNQYKIWILEKYRAMSLYSTGQKENAALQLQSCIDSIRQFIANTGFSMGFGKYYINNISKFLYQYYSGKKDWQKAFYFLSLNKQIEDTLAILSNRGKVFEVSQKYNYTKKELAITQLQNDNLVRKKQTILAMAIATGSLLVFILFALLLRANNRKLKLKKQQAELDAKQSIERLTFTSQLQIMELEEKNLLIKQEEQKKLGMELHDDLAGTVAAVKMKVETELSNSKDSLQAERLKIISKHIADIYERTRNKSHQLYHGIGNEPEMFFSKRIKLITDNSFASGKYKININVDDGFMKDVGLEIKIQMLYIIQEAVTNIIRHSLAENISILIYEEINSLILNITDDGKGFNKSFNKKGIGLHSIRQRSVAVNGTTIITSGIKGTEITVTIPFVREASV